MLTNINLKFFLQRQAAFFINLSCGDKKRRKQIVLIGSSLSKPAPSQGEQMVKKSLLTITIIALFRYWAQVVEQWLSVRVGRVQIQGLTFGSDCQYALA